MMIALPYDPYPDFDHKSAHTAMQKTSTISTQAN
jgi:hypothetical protein